MRIGITPKIEVLRVKSLKQHILQEIKESSKSGIYLVVFLVSGAMSKGTRPYRLKLFDKKISADSTSGECITYVRTILKLNFP